MTSEPKQTQLKGILNTYEKKNTVSTLKFQEYSNRSDVNNSNFNSVYNDNAEYNDQQSKEKEDKAGELYIQQEREMEVENYNSKFKIDLDKLNQDNDNYETNKLKKKYSDMTLTHAEGISQISRISLKNNNYPIETTSSKLRAVYKKVNENSSFFNITNVKSSENQLIKFFSNNRLYENNTNQNNVTKLAAASVKDKKPAQTAKKLASDVISIYRKNISNQLKNTEEKSEAKELINKQATTSRKFTDKIVKKKHNPEVDVETIMRSPVQKYATSTFPCNNNQTLLSIASKASVPQINTNSRLLSPTKHFKQRLQTDITIEEKQIEDYQISNVLKKKLKDYERRKTSLFKSTTFNTNNKLDCLSLDLSTYDKVCKDENQLFYNKYKTIVLCADSQNSNNFI